MKKTIKSIAYSALTLSVLLSGCGVNKISPILIDNPDYNNGSENYDYSDNTLTPEEYEASKRKSSTPNTGSGLESTNEASSIESFVIASYRRVFNEYDKNRSASIEPQELSEAPKAFEEMDKDKNKRLSFSEIAPTPQRVKQMSGWIFDFYRGMAKNIDLDGDKMLSPKELGSSEELKVFNDLGYWTRNYNSLNKNSASKGINYTQFNIFMNNLFLELNKKYMNYKNPVVRRNNKLPVVMVHGYGEPGWYFMYGIYRDLRKNDWQALYPISLFPNINDIKEQAKLVASKIDLAKKEQGVNKVDYVCHSMGGLIGRHYIQEMRGANNIDHFVSIATPHYGTQVAWLGIGEAAKQMRPGSDFLSKLNAGNPIYGSIKYTSIWTKTDEIVIPSENAVLRGSRIMPDIKNVGHFLILWSDETYKQVKEALTDQF